MVKSRASRGILLTSNLPQLQNLIKRDPAGYKEEFLTQWNHYESLRRIFSLKPDEEGELFGDLVGFIAQVAQCYPEETKDFPGHIRTLLLDHHRSLSPDTRKTLVRNLVMLRNKEVIDSIELLQTLFPLLPLTTSQTLRSFIRKTILTDIKTANAKTKNHKLNRVVQALLFGMVERGMDGEVVGDKGKAKLHAAGEAKGGEAMWAVTMVKELWRKGVWNDPKTVSIAALACAHPNVKVQSAGIHFFLGSENDDEEDSSEDDAGPDLKKLEHQRIINKKKRADDRRFAKAQATVKKKRKEKEANAAGGTVNFPALELLHDPQSFGEKLYDNVNRHDKQYSLDHKILIMQLLSRVMGLHKLCVLGFYSYIIKYLTYHQISVTLILVSLAQSVHELTPPDVLTPVIRKLAQEFVHPGVGAEVIAAGINAIREVCRRQPWCMEEELLGDLIEYRKSKDKGVTTAARGLLQLFREVNPGLLKRRERGKAASMGLTADQAPAFGHSREVPDGIEGLDLLEDHFAALQKKAEDGSDAGSDAEDAKDGNDGWGDDWEAQSDSNSDSSDGWQSVSSEGEDDIYMSDSEDDEKERERGNRERRERKEKKRQIGKERKQVSEAAAEDEDVDMDDAKSVVSVAPSVAPSVAATDMSEGTRKLTLLAQQKILTPADFALLNELRLKAATDLAANGGGSAAKRKLAALEASKKHASTADNEQFLTEGEILGPRKKAKADYEERMESIRKGREGREKFGSTKGRRKTGTPSSSTNREKARNKPIMMAVHSNKVVQKKKASLRDKQIKLRASIDKAKKMKH